MAIIYSLVNKEKLINIHTISFLGNGSFNGAFIGGTFNWDIFFYITLKK